MPKGFCWTFIISLKTNTYNTISMSSATSSTDDILVKICLIDSLALLSTITPTLGPKFIDGHHADNHKILLMTNNWDFLNLFRTNVI